MAIVSPEDWPDYVWTEDEVRFSFDPDTYTDLIRPFIAAIGERCNSIHGMKLKTFVGHGANNATGWQYLNNVPSSSPIQQSGVLDDIFAAGGVTPGTQHDVMPFESDSAWTHPLWSPALRVYPTYVRPSYFRQADESANTVTIGATTRLPLFNYGETWDTAVTWPDRFIHSKYNYMFSGPTTVNGVSTFGGSPNTTGRDDAVRSAYNPYPGNTSFTSSFGRFYGTATESGTSDYWFHGYPSSPTDTRPTGEDVDAGYGRVAKTVGVAQYMADETQDGEVLQGSKGWHRLQLGAWRLRLWFLWPQCPHRNLTVQGDGSRSTRTPLPHSTVSITPSSAAPAAPQLGVFGQGNGNKMPVPMRYFPMPFRRKYYRVIRRLDCEGTEGDIAQFRVYKGSERFLASRPNQYSYKVTEETPEDQYENGGKLFVFTSGVWVANTDPDVTEADILESFGLAHEGDLFGGWILNDLHDFINRLVCTTGWTIPTYARQGYSIRLQNTYFGDPYDCRPSFFVRVAPALHYSNSGLLAAGIRRTRPFVLQNITGVGANSSGSNNPLNTTYGTIANQNLFGGLFCAYDEITSTDWDTDIIVRDFNPASEGMSRRIEWIGDGITQTSAISFNLDCKSTFDTNPQTIDGSELGRSYSESHLSNLIAQHVGGDSPSIRREGERRQARYFLAAD